MCDRIFLDAKSENDLMKMKHLRLKTEAEVKYLIKRGFYRALDKLLFSCKEINFPILYEMEIRVIIRRKLYALAFAKSAIYEIQLFPLEFLLAFLATTNSYPKVPEQEFAEEILLEQALEHHKLIKWLAIQGIVPYTLNDIRNGTRIPKRPKLCLHLNEQFLQCGELEHLLPANEHHMALLYLKYRYLPLRWNYAIVYGFITAYEEEPNPDFVRENIEIFRREFTFDHFASKLNCNKLFKLVYHPDMQLDSKIVLQWKTTLKFVAAVAKRINWTETPDHQNFSNEFLHEVKSQHAYLRQRKHLTEPLLLSYFQQGFTFAQFIPHEPEYNTLVQADTIQAFFYFRGLTTEKVFEWQPQHYHSLIKKQKNLVRTLFILHGITSLNRLPREIMYQIIHFCVVTTFKE